MDPGNRSPWIKDVTTGELRRPSELRRASDLREMQQAIMSLGKRHEQERRGPLNEEPVHCCVLWASVDLNDDIEEHKRRYMIEVVSCLP